MKGHQYRGTYLWAFEQVCLAQGFPAHLFTHLFTSAANAGLTKDLSRGVLDGLGPSTPALIPQTQTHGCLFIDCLIHLP